MRKESWSRVRELYESALDLSPAARLTFVRGACGRDEELRAQVERLLEHASGDADFLTPPPETHLAETLAAPLGPRVGERLGAYQIERMLGSGGMGTVFIARQERPDRLVALKVMRSLSASEHELRRFAFEAEVLGRLRHPGIAAIHEAGTAQGQGGAAVPFFAMEFVEDARDIATWARERKLGLAKMLELIGEVAAAIEYAHQRGVLHRDLKPGNVLIDAQGRAKVIDFGVARLAGAELAAERHTLQGTVLGTLVYASPEQLTGDSRDLDVRTDVYALGAILYELVTGRPPRELGDRPLAEFLAQLATREADPPSRARPDLPRELDWIIGKALRREREERYGSVAEFAADLERFRAHLPVQAGPPSKLYALRKFVRRHRLGVAAVALALAGLIAALVTVSLALEEAEASQAQAAKALIEKGLEAEKAQRALRHQIAVQQTWEAMLRAPSPERDGRTITLYELLERKSATLESEHADDPALRASLEEVLSRAYFDLGLVAPSARLAERVLLAREQGAAEDPAALARARILAARLATLQGRYEEASKLLDLALPVLREDELWPSPDAVIGLRIQGQLQHQRGRFEAAEQSYREAIALGTQVQGERNIQVLTAMTELAQVLASGGKLAEAERMARAAHEALIAAFGSEHPWVLPAALRLGRVLEAQGKVEELVELQAGVVSRCEVIYGPEHRNTLQARCALADALRLDGALSEAVLEARAVVERHQAALPNDSDLEVLARAALADALAASRGFFAAAEEYERALRPLETRAWTEHPLYRRLRMEAGQAWSAAREFERAERAWAGVVEWLESVEAPDHEHLLHARGRWGEALVELGRTDEGEPLLRAAVDGLRLRGLPSYELAQLAFVERLIVLADERGTVDSELVRERDELRDKAAALPAR